MKKIIPSVFFSILILLSSVQTVKAQSKVTPVSSLQLNLLINRLHGAEARLDRIGQKIASRLGKMKESKLNVAKLDSAYASIVEQLLQLKKKSAQLETTSATWLNSPDSTQDYKLFRQELLDINTSLKTILNSEKNLIGQMKRYVVPTSKATVTLKSMQ